MKVIADIETNGLGDQCDQLWIFGGRNLETRELYQFEPWRGEQETKAAIEWAGQVDHWIGHNFISYDAVVTNKLLKSRLIDPNKITDTLVEARTTQYNRAIPRGARSAHSLDAWGLRLGVHKGHYSDWKNYSPEMVEYWKGDLETTEALYHHLARFREDKEWQPSLFIEHQTQIEMVRQRYYGFGFNKDEGITLLGEVQEALDALTEAIQTDYPPTLNPYKTIQYRKTKDGEEYATVQKARAEADMVAIDGSSMTCYRYEPFNPGSPAQRIEKLWEAGWQPFEKTKSHQKFNRMRVGDAYGKTVESMDEEFYQTKRQYFETYGWVCNEDNLNTLPETAPEGAKRLSQWLTLEGRRSSLAEWLGHVREDDRIHGSTVHIGAWTGRGAHKDPNTANISSVWPESKVARSPVEEIKKAYDTRMRGLWCVPEGSLMVGVDADGIQLRILADWLWRHFDAPSYADAILKGNKDEGTDIHNVNRQALSLPHIVRDDAKTFKK